ncbi:MAG: phytanoyl-CoA dioxygenase family protein [Planctomycetota bacterium]
MSATAPVAEPTTPSSPDAPFVAPSDPRLSPNFAVTDATFRKPRLDQDAVAAYCRDGFHLYKQPVLRKPQFESLTQHFEMLLEEHTKAGLRPEAMDTPHFGDHRLFEWIFSDEILDLVEPLVGPNIALFSSHFLAKPAGNGKRVPWHEDSFYWRNLMEPMHVCTVWLSIDPSIPENGCMNVIPSALHGYSEYEDVDEDVNVFGTEVKWLKNVTTDHVDRVTDGPEHLTVRAAACELRPNEASLHDARLIHGSDPNKSNLRRCGYTMRFIPASVLYRSKNHKWPHQIYLARGQGHPDNHYADPTKDYPDLFNQRYATGNSH